MPPRAAAPGASAHGHPPPARAKSDPASLPRPCPGVGRDRSFLRSPSPTSRGGIGEIGHDGVGLAFDNERPRHRVLTEPFRLADRLVTNAEWMEFIEDGRYTKPLRLSEGWAKALAEGWSRPLYWETRDGQHWTTTLRGFRLVDPTAPVVHVSYFETDAFATWSGKRLPSESAKTRRGRQLPGPQSPQAQTRHQTPLPQPGLQRFQNQVFCATLCRHRGSFLQSPKSLQHNDFRCFGAPMRLIDVRNAG